MNIIIYGAGAIGCTVGGYLFRAGREVTLIGRPGQVRAINEKGLKFHIPSGEEILNIRAVTQPAEIAFKPGDVVFLAMKGQNTAEALRDLSKVVTDVPVFCFQNGIRNEEIASSLFPRVYGVMVRVGAEYMTEGEIIVRSEPPGLLIIGCYPRGLDSLATEMADILRLSGFLVKPNPDVMQYKWGKLVGNLMNAVDAITNVGGKQVEFIVNAVRQEFAELLKAAGVTWISMDELAKEIPANRASTPGASMHGSTWQSLARRQGTTESEFLNGEAVRLAKRLGKEAPLNEKLLRIVQEMAANGEMPGKYTPEQLGALLGLNNQK